MSNTPNDGGPAFPQVGAKLQVKDGVYFLDNGGMTLRDYFAGQALTGPAMRELILPEHLASRAYAVADAMLAARHSSSRAALGREHAEREGK